ncbi:DUF6967 family protein [Alkalilimnicola ehrlichii]|uniref:DUF6967 family protein n=1 Tax=Alkalilimnicola ehrlichii TaxID=351052 RepID=UPI003B9E281D
MLNGTEYDLPEEGGVKTLHELSLAWGADCELQAVTHPGGLPMLRMRLRQGRRFTDVELTEEMALEMAQWLQAWARAKGG